MCFTTSQYEIGGKNSHLLSQKVFIRSIICPSEKTIHWNKQHFGIRYRPSPLFLHYVSQLNITDQSSIVCCYCCFLTFFLHYFYFCSFLIIKKNCPWTRSMTGGPWTRSMKVVHGPGPKWGSMHPWSMFCPHPPAQPTHKMGRLCKPYRFLEGYYFKFSIR